MKRPGRRSERFPSKMRFLAKTVAADKLEKAAVAAVYAPSPYHCKENGRLRRRVKPATPCPRVFTFQEAGNAIRAAIRSRQVSVDWIGDFPRQIWHQEGEVWYEACTGTGTAGTYHAYPIEVTGLPAGLQK